MEKKLIRINENELRRIINDTIINAINAPKQANLKLPEYIKIVQNAEHFQHPKDE